MLNNKQLFEDLQILKSDLDRHAAVIQNDDITTTREEREEWYLHSGATIEHLGTWRRKVMRRLVHDAEILAEGAPDSGKMRMLQQLNNANFRSLEYKRGYVQAMLNAGIITDVEYENIAISIRNDLLVTNAIDEETEPDE
jgi:hypothetical protein